MKELGQSIKERRRTLRINQHTLADLAGISVNTLYKLERGESNPTVDVLQRVADVLGLELKLGVKKIESCGK